MREQALRWLRAAMLRAVRTVAQTAAAALSTSALLSEVHWAEVLSAALLAGLLSLVTSLAGLPEVDAGRGIDRPSGENEGE